MTRTHNQKMADMHEADMATWINGHQTKSSGNQWHSRMDVKNGSRDVSIPMAGDGKSTCRRSISVTRDMWEKSVIQAGPAETPFMALRFYRDETLEQVGLDLVLLDVHAFRRLLEGARAWEDQQESLEAGLADFEKGVREYEASGLLPVAEAPQAAHTTGCDCCR